MADRFGIFVVYHVVQGERVPLSIETTEADARGEAHEVAIARKPQAEVGYLEIPNRAAALARLRHEGHDVRGRLADLGYPEEFEAFELYLEAKVNGVWDSRSVEAAQ